LKKLADRLPINRTAAMVTQKGTSFNPVIKPSEHRITDIRPPVWKGEHKVKFDLTGRTFGRFKVIGLSVEKRGRWVCRCACGNYEMRTAKAINNPANAELDRCIICRKTLYITTGRDSI
jgi:hypothetical protein